MNAPRLIALLAGAAFPGDQGGEREGQRGVELGMPGACGERFAKLNL